MPFHVDWSPGWGDPTLSGYVLTAGYVLLDLLLLALVSSRRCRGRRQWFWLGITAIYLAVGLNKQLDLQTLLTAVARQLSRQEGWYAERRAVGIALVCGFALACLSMVPRWFRWWRAAFMPERLALGGVAILMFFVLLRLADFRGIDVLPIWVWETLHLHRFIELASIVCVALGAWARWRAPSAGHAEATL